MPIVEVEGLSKRFGNRVALDGVSFTAERGEVLGFLGPNGAGKTTTMRILAGVIPSSAGRVRIAGLDVARDGLAARARVGFLPERVPLYDEMRVGAFLRFVAAMKGLVGRAAARAAARAAEEAGLRDAAREPIGRLSRGFRQRVGLAQALLGDPPVLLLDEPTAGLDPRQIAETRALVRRLGTERTILVSTHILPEVSATCGRVVILSRGRVVAVDTPAALAARVSGGRRVELVVEGSAVGLRERLERIPGVREARELGSGRFAVAAATGADPRPEIAAAVLASGARLLELRAADRSLEEVFLHLVTDEPAGGAA